MEVVEKDIVHTTSETGWISNHLYRQQNQTADTWPHKGAGGKADIWVNERKWNLRDQHLSDDIETGAEGEMGGDVKWSPVQSTGWSGSQCVKVASFMVRSFVMQTEISGCGLLITILNVCFSRWCVERRICRSSVEYGVST